MNQKSITQHSYEETATQYSRNVEDLAPLPSIQKFVQLLPKKAKILDLGCGSGRDAKIFTEMGLDVVGIDFCTAMLEIAKTQAPKATFLQMDIEQIDFPVQSFEGIWAACSLLHLPKNHLPAVLKKLHSFLKSGGYCYISLKKGQNEGLETDLRYGAYEKYCSYYEQEEFQKLLQMALFKIVEATTVEKHHHYHTHQALRFFCHKVS